jgi:hypothetical protein
VHAVGATADRWLAHLPLAVPVRVVPDGAADGAGAGDGHADLVGIIGTTGVANDINVQLSSAPGRGGGGTCFGDSGGPTLLYGTDIIVAVTSFGMSANVCGGTEFDFRVDTVAVQEWMQSVLTDEQWAEIDIVSL